MIEAAVIGVGGIGAAAGRIMAQKGGFRVVGLVDRFDLAADAAGLNVDQVLERKKSSGSLSEASPAGRPPDDPVASLLRAAPGVEALLLSVPSIPHDLVARQVLHLIELGFKGAVVDVLDQSGALAQVLPLEEKIRAAGMTYVTGCGCTPGLLTAAASLCAHSFIEVEEVRIHFGVGIAGYLERDEASLREVLAGWRGMGVKRAEALTKDEIRTILEEENGLLDVSGLSHGDDVLIERSGVAPRDRVEVGGRIDTTKDLKPTTTTVTVTGLTFDGRRSSHELRLGNETSMFANTAGPAVGYLARAVELNRRKVTGLFGSTDLIPCFIH
ncbi:MAG: saccharopine dehydrogenase-like oxidoreductase [Thermodesulfobacteriota bacterium]